MEYCVNRIEKKEEITSCERFEIRNFQWVDGPRPETWGYMGYLAGQGLYVEMCCREANPRRECKGPKGRYVTVKGKRVCDDSAMEIFVGFPGKDGKMTRDSLYLNFEINANGVMYACFGAGRKNRSFLSEKVYEQAGPETSCEDGVWTARVLIPEEFLREVSGVEIGRPDAVFYCNFYKISETPEIEHYGSFAAIDSGTPDFHRPDCFARAVVAQG